MAHFLKGALGLELEASIPIPRAPLAQFDCPGAAINSESLICAGWMTNRGCASICGFYDDRQSRHVRAHVMWLAWCLPPDTRHRGWWRCDRNRPNEWTKGRGY